MMEVNIHSINNGYKDNFVLDDHEELVFYVEEGEKVTRFYSSDCCPDRGSGTYNLSVTAGEIDEINWQTTDNTPINYQMTPRFEFISHFVSDEKHEGWNDYFLIHGHTGDEYSASVMSIVGFRSDVQEEFMNRMENASGEEMEQIWQDIIDSDAAYVKTSNISVVCEKGNHPDALIYMGIVDKV